MVFFALLLAFCGPTAEAQIGRPPRLNVQFHRAETAWRSGSSLLEAKARIDRVLKELPDDIEARKLRAGIFLSMKRPADALMDALSAAELDSTDGEAHLLVCEAGVRAHQNSTALPALYVAADHHLERRDYHVRLSRCAVALDRLDEAEAYARIAFAGDEKDPMAIAQLARVFVLSDQDESAVTILEKGLRLRLIDPKAVQKDSVLRQIAAYPAISDWFRN